MNNNNNLSNLNLEDLLQNTIEIAKKACKLIEKGFHNPFEVEHKGTVDLVTEIDLAAEKLIKTELSAAYPNIPFHGEEGGGASYNDPLVWVVDPLDGTTNFAKGLAHFAVSIALCQNGNPVLGVVAQPITKEVFHCIKNKGAFLNVKPIKVSQINNMNDALTATGFPYNRRDHMDIILKRLRAILMHAAGVRRFGSAALDLCYVAKGVYSIFWEQGLKPWDVAAGKLLVEEAGGKVSKMDGELMELDSQNLLATNGLLHKETIKLFSEIS